MHFSSFTLIKLATVKVLKSRETGYITLFYIKVNNFKIRSFRSLRIIEVSFVLKLADIKLIKLHSFKDNSAKYFININNDNTVLRWQNLLYTGVRVVYKVRIYVCWSPQHAVQSRQPCGGPPRDRYLFPRNPDNCSLKKIVTQSESEYSTKE